ncbi:response regulator transcription factor [Natribacillus halophilus]|uniref:DNA-binding response regulator, OmpR family, contains REC and winged-helix (WHTH) domain n=1 Tax=Natribacillus halophilus TaxID=549003 RepID=A0A1G8S1X3_9BACI|nr:response regulator transcription factor [Natribacillus halophilus]SDJ23237.1 DNA-binding response regulator, OmpR family, contains REC and winged-helix (wHTH) domain [Natribacillus halophilus]
MYSVVIVEDDDKIAGILRDHLQRYGYSVSIAQQLDAIKAECVEIDPDLVLLDINLPYFDGFYWCRQIRSVSTVPVIFISARTDDMNQVMAIENGGDDYITKPFHLDVVTAKIKSVLRRAYGEYALNNAHSQTAELAGLFIHPEKNELVYGSGRIELSKKEFTLFRKLSDAHDRIVSRDDLLEALWDEVDFVDDNTLSVNVNRLRKRLQELAIYDAIQTIRGQGYRLNVNWREDIR